MSDSQEVDPIGESIELMRQQIAKLEAAIEGLEAVRSMVNYPGNSKKRQEAEVSFGHDAFFGMKASDAAEKYLNARKKTASPKTIADALQEGGWMTASKNVPENIRTILNRNPTFVVINGEFGLAEWYPGRKSANKRQRANVALSSSEDESSGDHSSASSSEEES
jgi:hypothetical protein